jgi:hypothetical protein
MKKKSALLWVMVILLVSLGVGLTVHKSQSLGVPFLPGRKVTSWTIEASVQFEATGKPVLVDLGLPPVKLDAGTRQNVASLGFGYQENSTPSEGRRGVWSANRREGPQRLYFQITLPEEELRNFRRTKNTQTQVEPVMVGGSEAEVLAREMLRKEVREKSANTETFVSQLRERLFGDNLGQEAGFLRRSYQKRFGEGWEQSLLKDFLQAEGIAHRNAWGVILNETLGAQQPVRMIEYFDGREWRQLEAVGNRELGELVVWSRGLSLLDVTGGRDSQVLFNVEEDVAPLEAVEALRRAPAWAGSIAALPLSERRVFRYIALIPVGAFVIVFLRNFIGINMLGTFMPVLLALSFLEIPLLPALVMFVAVLAAGLSFRFFLSRLNLLVVPRVAACVVIVSLLMIVFGLFSYRLGLTVGLKVTVFPMVVLAWTIERMSMLWDEEGAQPALLQAGGSIVAAVLAYLLMRVPTVDYWALYFPELLLILLAGILLIGRYTGYRLSELFRFKSFPAS